MRPPRKRPDGQVKEQIPLKTILYPIALIVVLGSCFAGSAHAREHARGDDESAVKLLEGNPELAETIALYPEYLRQDMLVAARHPEALVKLANMQARSRSTFAILVGKLPEQRQEMLWEVISVPGLIENLVEIGPGNHRALNTRLREYPPEVHRPARVLVQESSNVLREVAALNRNTEENLVGYIRMQPDDARQSLQRLLQVPEVLDILAADIGTTARLGKAYATTPDVIDEHLAALHLQLARRHGRSTAADRHKAHEADLDVDLPGIYTHGASRPSDRPLFTEVGNRIYDYDGALVEGDSRRKEVIINRVYRPYPHVYRYPYWRVYHHPHWRVHPWTYPGLYLDWHVTPGFYLSWSHRLYPRPPLVHRRVYQHPPRTVRHRRPVPRYRY